MVHALDSRAGLAAAACQVVRRRHAERQRELRRSPRARPAAEQGRPDLGRRARRSPHADLLRSLPAGQPVRQRAQVARRVTRRPRGHLPAARAGAGDRDAGLRAHRRRAFGGLRRLQLRIPARSDQRRPGHAPRHRRRRLAPRAGGAAEADGRRGARGHAVDQARRRGAAAGRLAGAAAHQGGPRPLVPPADAGRLVRVRA